MFKLVISDSKFNRLEFKFDFMEDAQKFIEMALMFTSDKDTRVEIVKEHIETEGGEE